MSLIQRHMQSVQDDLQLIQDKLDQRLMEMNRRTDTCLQEREAAFQRGVRAAERRLLGDPNQSPSPAR